MLYFDLAAMPNDQLVRCVMNVCKNHGAVSSIRIERGPVQRRAAQRAIVEMTSLVDAIRMRREIGDSMSGLFVTVDLHQRRNRRTILERSRLYANAGDDFISPSSSVML